MWWWGGGGGAKAVRHDKNFYNFFNLNNFTISNKAYIVAFNILKEGITEILGILG